MRGYCTASRKVCSHAFVRLQRSMLLQIDQGLSGFIQVQYPTLSLFEITFHAKSDSGIHTRNIFVSSRCTDLAQLVVQGLLVGCGEETLSVVGIAKSVAAFHVVWWHGSAFQEMNNDCHRTLNNRDSNYSLIKKEEGKSILPEHLAMGEAL